MGVNWLQKKDNFFTGKYALEFAQVVLEKGGINLQKMALGNAWVSPV